MSPENRHWRDRLRQERRNWSGYRPVACLTVRWHDYGAHLFMMCVRERTVFR